MNVGQNRHRHQQLKISSPTSVTNIDVTFHDLDFLIFPIENLSKEASKAEMMKLKSWLEKQEFMDMKDLKFAVQNHESIQRDFSSAISELRRVFLLIFRSMIVPSSQ